MTACETSALIPSCSVDAIIAERDATVGAADKIAEAISAAPTGALRIEMHCRGGDRVTFCAAQCRREANASAWDRLLRETGLWSFLDRTARDQWRAMIDETAKTPRKWDRDAKVTALPEFTIDAARSLVLSVHEDRAKMVARGVADVHRRLSADFRRNEAGRFAKRTVLKRLATVWGPGNWLSICHHAAEDLDDLSRFLHLVRGLPEPDHREGSFAKLSAVTASAPCDVEMEFWTIHLFKNGNGHLRFKFDADVDRLNLMLAKASDGAIADTERRSRTEATP